MASPAYSSNFYSDPTTTGGQTSIHQLNDFTSNVSYIPHYPASAQQAMYDHPPPPLPLFHSTAATHHAQHNPYCMSLPYFAPQYIVPTVVRTTPPAPYSAGASPSYYFCAPNVSASNYAAGVNYNANWYQANGYGNGHHHNRSSNRYAVKFTTKINTNAAKSCCDSSKGNIVDNTVAATTTGGTSQPVNESCEQNCDALTNGSKNYAECKVDDEQFSTVVLNGSAPDEDSSTPKQVTLGKVDVAVVAKKAPKTYSERVASSLKQHVENGIDRRYIDGSKSFVKKASIDKKPKNVDTEAAKLLNTGCQTEFPPVVSNVVEPAASSAESPKTITRDVVNTSPPKSNVKQNGIDSAHIFDSPKMNGEVQNTTEITVQGVSGVTKSWASLFMQKLANLPAQSVDKTESVPLKEKSPLNNGHNDEKVEAVMNKSVSSTATFDEIAAKKAAKQILKNSSSLTGFIEDSAAQKMGTFVQLYNLAHRGFPYQLRGLNNHGSWCYVNAALQALIACPPFVHLLRDISRFLPVRSSSVTPTLDAMVEFVAEFSEKTTRRGPQDLDIGTSFHPTSIYNLLKESENSKAFKGRQEDAEEFLSFLLNNMHEEMITCMNYADEAKTHDLNAQDEDDSEEWQQVGPNRKSMITRTSKITTSPVANIFSGLLRNTTQQQNAGTKSSANLESFFVLPLDIQSEEITSVQSALLWMHKETIKSAGKGKHEVTISRRTTFQELPTVLILQLKYFVCSENGISKKLIKNVDYGMDLSIDRTLLTLCNSAKFDHYSRLYKLFAVVYHHGTKAENGHYTACVFHGGFWVTMDDTRVTPIDERSVLSLCGDSSDMHRVPYLLFYRRCDSFADRRVMPSYHNNNQSMTSSSSDVTTHRQHHHDYRNRRQAYRYRNGHSEDYYGGGGKNENDAHVSNLANLSNNNGDDVPHDSQRREQSVF